MLQMVKVFPVCRECDFQLSLLDGCIFVDLKVNNDKLIFINAISFDGYGFTGLYPDPVPLDKKESEQFLYWLENKNADVHEAEKFFLKLIALNKHLIWNDALKEYNLI